MSSVNRRIAAFIFVSAIFFGLVPGTIEPAFAQTNAAEIVEVSDQDRATQAASTPSSSASKSWAAFPRVELTGADPQCVERAEVASGVVSLSVCGQRIRRC